jgi:uncharacterized protein YggE
MKSHSRARLCGQFFSLCLAIVAPHVGSAQNVVPSAASPQIMTTGVGEAQVTPDRAVISIGVQTRASTAAQAGADNARRQRAILDTLRALGAKSEQLSTNGYNVYPEMSGGSPQTPPRVSGYTVSNTVRVDVRNLDDISRFIDAALAKGANSMSGLQFYSSKADSARRAALASAVANARADAEIIARAGGGTVGALILLSSGEAQSPRPMEAPMARMAMASPTPIEAGLQTVSATVTAHWVFIAGR